MSNDSGHNPSRRKFIKKLAYVPPVVLTLSAVPSYATTGSPRSNGKIVDKKNTTKGGGRRGWFHRLVASFGF